MPGHGIASHRMSGAQYYGLVRQAEGYSPGPAKCARMYLLLCGTHQSRWGSEEMQGQYDSLETNVISDRHHHTTTLLGAAEARAGSSDPAICGML